MYDLAIQIVNYNTKNYLDQCLRTLFTDLEHFSLKYIINILDNNSKDDLSDIEKKYRKANKINFYKSKKNLGFAGGHNFLSKKSKSHYILILNPDIKFIEDRTIERLYKRIISNSKIKVVGPQLITEKGRVQWWDHGELEGFIAHIALNSGTSHWKKRTNLSRVAWVSGAAFLIESKIFNSIGGFDENFFLYKEEEELCWRLRKKKWLILYDPSIRVFHYGSVVAKKKDYQKKSVDYFIDKHLKGKIKYRLCKLLNKIIH